MPALLEALLGYLPDVLVLKEHRHNVASTLLREALRAAGLCHQIVSHDDPRVNHLLVASRRPLQSAPQLCLGFDRQRLLCVRVENLRLVAAHLPNLRAKLPHWEALLHLASSGRRTPTIYVGDFNTGHNLRDVENGPFPFTTSAQMEALLARGWVDAWRHLHPHAREFTWFSHRSRGFRLDNVFLSPACAPWLRGAWFDHAVRETGATDHSALIVDLQDSLKKRRDLKAAVRRGRQNRLTG
jgi:exonuclease III